MGPEVSAGTVLIAGPTASGKSQVALRLAEALAEFGGARIINADSMQVYRELRIVTARPTPRDEARADHRLYGVLSVLDACSAGRWRELALEEIAAAYRDGVVPVVVGGTGMYLRVLTEGIAAVPAIPEAIRKGARARLQELGLDAFRAEVAARDSVAAAALQRNDGQRLVRAWEVIEATGRPLHEWQRGAQKRALPGPLAKFVILPDRQGVYARGDARVLGMVGQGVYDEVKQFQAMAPAADLPASRAIGLREFQAWVDGNATKEETIAAVQQATRQYARRQFTWLRTQAADWPTYGRGFEGSVQQYPESLFAEIFPFIRDFLLTHRGAAD